MLKLLYVSASDFLCRPPHGQAHKGRTKPNTKLLYENAQSPFSAQACAQRTFQNAFETSGASDTCAERQCKSTEPLLKPIEVNVHVYCSAWRASKPGEQAVHRSPTHKPSAQAQRTKHNAQGQRTSPTHKARTSLRTKPGRTSLRTKQIFVRTSVFFNTIE